VIKVEWLHTGSIIVSVIGAIYYFGRDIKTDIALQTARLDTTNARLDASNARSDQLYQMFIDLLKEKK
jgi:hypothetical protein